MKEIKRLTNSEMENIVGGTKKDTVCGCLTFASGAVAVGSLVSALGCKVGSLAWRVKAGNALKRGDKGAFCKFNGRANGCSIAAASCVLGTVAGAAGFAGGFYASTKRKWSVAGMGQPS